jgi:hypothetical protein
MALATSQGGQLKTLNDKCKITIAGHEINLKILPEISDSKKATYADTTIIGRSNPIKTYSHSDNRVISMKLHFIVIEKSDIEKNYKDLWAIASATYPRNGNGDAPYFPPPVCQIDCGKGLGDQPLCVILENYSVSFPTNVAWDKDTLMPYYFEVQTSWHVVYSSSNLPNQDKILGHGV